MEKIIDRLEAEVAKKRNHDKGFLEQLERNRRFKEKMSNAGVSYGDKFTIPLMSRLGHIVPTK